MTVVQYRRAMWRLRAEWRHFWFRVCADMSEKAVNQKRKRVVNMGRKTFLRREYQRDYARAKIRHVRLHVWGA